MEEKKKDVKEIKKDVTSKENNKKTENSSKNKKIEKQKNSSNEKEMKPSRIDNKLKITLSILVIILVCAISFGGIFIQDKGRVNSIIPEYSLGMDLEGSRKLGVIVDDTVNEVIYDKDGKVVTEEGKDTTKKEEPVNPKEVLTKENFEKSKEIVNKRLQLLNVPDYTIGLDEENGYIMVDMLDYADRYCSTIYVFAWKI